MNTIKRRKLEYLGYMMKNDVKYNLKYNLQGKVLGKDGAGRRIISWLKNLRRKNYWTLIIGDEAEMSEV